MDDGRALGRAHRFAVAPLQGAIGEVSLSVVVVPSGNIQAKECHSQNTQCTNSLPGPNTHALHYPLLNQMV